MAGSLHLVPKLKFGNALVPATPVAHAAQAQSGITSKKLSTPFSTTPNSTNTVDDTHHSPPIIQPSLQVKWLGRIAYLDALALQDKLAGEHTGDTLLLLEHEPVYTIGRTPDQSSLAPVLGKVLPHPVIQTNRGGQATYHGPGQLVGYPIIDLNNRRRDLHHYLRTLEELLLEVLAIYGLTAQRREGLTGVWIENRKIASIGVGVRKWITMHGFALNVGSDLTGFDSITPCGIAGVTMTSLSRELNREIPVKDFADACANHFQAELLLRLT